MAAAAASADDSVSVFRCGLADRELPDQFRRCAPMFSAPPAYSGWFGMRLSSSSRSRMLLHAQRPGLPRQCLCGKSDPDVHAGYSHDGIVVPGIVHLVASRIFAEFVREVRANGSDHLNSDAASAWLMKSGWCVLGACLTRYDGWLLAGVLCVACARRVVTVSKRETIGRQFGEICIARGHRLRCCGWGITPSFIGNALEFANGPYSARASSRTKPRYQPLRRIPAGTI